MKPLLLIFAFVFLVSLVSQIHSEFSFTGESEISHSVLSVKAPTPAREWERSEKTIKTKISYYSEIDSCHYPKMVNGQKKCLTASGKIAEVGMVAANNYKFGTKLKINNKIYTVEDRISKFYKDRIDIFTGYGEEAQQEALKEGIKILSVIVQ